MEGENLLKRLKDGAQLGSLLADIQVYLSPILKHKGTLSEETANKYGLTALKMLRACVQTLSGLTLGSQYLSAVTSIACLCYKCIRAAKSRMKISTLSLEKVLFHVMLQLVNKSLLMDALAFADHLYAELTDSRPKFESEEGLDNEFDTIAKQAFNQLWKACAQIEESSKTGARHVLVLNARKHALALLMLTNQETSWVSECALRAALEMERHAGKDAACSDLLCQFFSDLVSKVIGMLDGKRTKSRLESASAPVLGPVLELCLQFAKYSILTDRRKNCVEMIMRVEKYTKHSKSSSQSNSIRAIFDLILATISLSDLCPPGKNSESKPAKNVKQQTHGSVEVCEQLCNASDALAKMVETGSLEPSLYQLMTDTGELLRKQLDGLLGKGNPPEAAAEVWTAGYRCLVTHMDILEAYKVHLLQGHPSPTDVFRGMTVLQFTSRLVQKQLSTLNFLANLTMMELNAAKTGSGGIPERSKEEYGSRALALCKRTKAVMEDVSAGGGGVISINEHRWLGSNAYNLGLICYKRGWYDFAGDLVQLACEQFHQWCSTEQGIDINKLKQIQLATKYELLVDCQRRAKRHRDAMTTVALSLLVIPDLGVDDVTSRVEQWVKAKRDTLKVMDDPNLRNRTLLDECQEMGEHLRDDHLPVIATALHEELKAYRVQRQDTSVEQFAVAQDQLRLFAGDDHRSERARALVHMARLVFTSGLDGECSAEEYCSQAAELLQTADGGTERDLQAQADFWLCLVRLEATIQDSRSPPLGNVDADPAHEPSAHGLAEDRETGSTVCSLDQEARLMEPLETALEIWAGLLLMETAGEEKEGEGDVDCSCFLDPASTLQCLQLSADIMAASGRTLAEMRILMMQSALARATTEDLQAAEADLRLTWSLARAGLTDHAAIVLSGVEKLTIESTASQRNALTADIGVAKCAVYLYAGQVQEFEKAFCEYLDQAAQVSGHRNCHTYLRSALTKELHSVYLSLPLAWRSVPCDRLTQDEHGDDLSPLDLLVEAMRLRMGVAKIVMGTDMNESSDHTADTDAGTQSESRWLVLSHVLQSLSTVASLFSQQGCVREAQCYITEGMALAQKFQLPRRYAGFQLQLTEVFTKWGQEEECQSALAALKKVLVEERRQNRPKPSEGRTSGGKAAKPKGKSKQKPRPKIESDEEDFIKTRPLSVSKCLEGKTVDLSNSPNLKQSSASCIPKVPQYVQHCQRCSCIQCTDFSRHTLGLGYFLSSARLSAHRSNFTEALSTLECAKELLECSKDRVQPVLERTLANVADHKQLSYSWPCHLRDLGKVLAMQAEVEIEMEKPDSAFLTAREGISLLESCPIILDRHLTLASFHYCMAMASFQKEGNAVIDSSWTMLHRTLDPLLQTTAAMDDVAHSFSNLKLSEPLRKVQEPEGDGLICQLFQGALDMSSARPERTRKRDSGSSGHGAVLDEELGLFSDVILDGKDAVFTEPASVKKNASKGKGRAKTAVQATTKKGSVTYKVTNKPGKTSAKSAVNDYSSSSVDADGVFSFDEEPMNNKKTAKRRGKRGCTKGEPSLTTSNNKPYEDTEDMESYTSSGKSKVCDRGRKSKAVSQVPAPAASSDELAEMVNDVIASFSDSASSKTDAPADVKPKRRQGRKTTKDPVAKAAQKETRGGGRRGRTAKAALESNEVEHIRGIPNPDPCLPPRLTLDDCMVEVLPVDSSTASASSPCDPDSPIRLDFTFEESQSCPDQPQILATENVSTPDLNGSKKTHASASSVSDLSVIYPLQASDLSLVSLPEEIRDIDKSASMLTTDTQEDFDDIEIPRAGSDSEDTKLRGRRRGKGAQNKLPKKSADEKLDNQVLSRKSVKSNTKKNSKSSESTNCCSNANGTELRHIREHLEQAFNLVKHLAPSSLYRHVCLLLALCQGDTNPAESALYLAQAASVTLRHQKMTSLNKKLRKLRKASEKEEEGLSSATNAPSLKQSCKEEEQRLQRAKRLFSFGRCDETNIVRGVTDALPEGYTVCQLSVISTKPSRINTLTASSHLVVSRMQHGQDPLVVRLPRVGGEGIVDSFDRILSESKEAVKETDKKVWWTTRQRLDEEMQSLTCDMENSLLGCWKGLLAGSYRDQRAQARLRGLGQRLGKLVLEAGGTEAHSTLCECLIDSYQHLSHQQINSALYSLSGCQPGTESLTRLAGSLRDLAKEWQKNRPDQRNPVVLILDTAIQQLPWESVPVLQAWPVCRLPSPHFLLSHLLQTTSQGQDQVQGQGKVQGKVQSQHRVQGQNQGKVQGRGSVLDHGVDSRKTFFVLNPTGDLANTQKTFQSWFQEENEWKGVVGRAPTKPEYASALADHDLFVFCGHGTGREFLTGDDIQRLTCRAATLLIGCSSGRLQVNGCLEASGMALNYLLAECPCVVANLWDVTDRDIDRFLEHLLKSWLPSGTKNTSPSVKDHRSLAGLLTEARQACKLKHLIGYSPVIYGLPAMMKGQKGS